MSKKDDFIEAYKKATGTDPATIDRTNQDQISEFRKNLSDHGLVSMFKEAVEETTAPPEIIGFANLFD